MPWFRLEGQGVGCNRAEKFNDPREKCRSIASKRAVAVMRERESLEWVELGPNGSPGFDPKCMKLPSTLTIMTGSSLVGLVGG